MLKKLAHNSCYCAMLLIVISKLETKLYFYRASLNYGKPSRSRFGQSLDVVLQGQINKTHVYSISNLHCIFFEKKMKQKLYTIESAVP